MDELTAERMVGLTASQTQMDFHLEQTRERQRAETMAQMRWKGSQMVHLMAGLKVEKRANQIQMDSPRAGSRANLKA